MSDSRDSLRRLLTASGSRRFVEDLAAYHLDRALRLSREARMPAALLAWLTGMRAALLDMAA